MLDGVRDGLSHNDKLKMTCACIFKSLEVFLLLLYGFGNVFPWLMKCVLVFPDYMLTFTISPV